MRNDYGLLFDLKGIPPEYIAQWTHLETVSQGCTTASVCSQGPVGQGKAVAHLWADDNEQVLKREHILFCLQSSHIGLKVCNNPIYTDVDKIVYCI